MAKKFKSVSISIETQKNLQNVAKLCGKSQNAVLSEILTPLARLLTSFDPTQKPVGFWVDYTTEPPSVQLTVYGRKRLMQITTEKEIEVNKVSVNGE